MSRRPTDQHVLSVNRTREGLFSAHCTCGWEAGPALAVHPELADAVELHGSTFPRDAPTLSDCPDCGVEAGEAHEDGCDVARCLATGRQALSCAGSAAHPGRVCGDDLWTGRWPGEAEAERYGLYVEEIPGAAVPDLNRLMTVGRWDADRAEWVIEGEAG
jgi:hypothetical protein